MTLKNVDHSEKNASAKKPGKNNLKNLGFWAKYSIKKIPPLIQMQEGTKTLRYITNRSPGIRYSKNGIPKSSPRNKNTNPGKIMKIKLTHFKNLIKKSV